ncbi:MAG: AraC family transcriptional regulator [Bacteroidota bacterium]|nr:AraC family transcriptional regulator [Bacteroidota bacterium]
MFLEHKQFDLYGKKIFEKIILKPPFRVNNEMPNDACFLYMEEGEYNVNSPAEHVQVHSKEAVLMRCGSYFTEFVKSFSSDTCDGIIIHLYPDVLKKIFENELTSVISTMQSDQKLISVNKYAGNELIRIYIDSLKIYFANPGMVNENLIVLKLKELIMLLMKTENAKTIEQLLSSLFTQREYSFREIIEAHVYAEFSIEKMALLTHLSVSSFKREFTKIYNDSPAHYFKHKKLERAAEMLAATNQRISDIAFDCGFNDLAHFSKSFQTKYGVSPSQFRLNQKDKSLS